MSTTSNHFTFNTLGPPGSNRNSTGIASVGGYKRSPTGIDGNKLSSSLFEMSPKSVLLACKHHTNLIWIELSDDTGLPDEFDVDKVSF